MFNSSKQQQALDVTLFSPHVATILSSHGTGMKGRADELSLSLVVSRSQQTVSSWQLLGTGDSMQ